MSELFTIPALEWEWFERPVCAGAPHKEQGYQTRRGWYYANVYRTELADGGWSGWRWYSKLNTSRICASPEEGKQLAEAHWRAYIKQALVPVRCTGHHDYDPQTGSCYCGDVWDESKPAESCLWKYDPDAAPST